MKQCDVDIKQTKMNWFERHLNWTVILALIVAYLAGFLILVSSTLLVEHTYDPVVLILCLLPQCGLFVVYGW